MSKHKNNKTSLLEDAIADAQIVLDTAIANAEATLTEKFRPRLKSLLAKHIQEEMDDTVDADDLDGYRDENGDEITDDDRYDDYEIDDIEDVMEGDLEIDIPDDDYEEEDDEEEMEMDEMDHDKDYEDEEEEMLSQEIAKLESMIADLREEDEDEDAEDMDDMDDMDYEDEDEEEMDEVFEFDLHEFIDGQMTRPAEIDAEDGHDQELSLGDEGEGIDAGSSYDIEGGQVVYDLHGDLTTEANLDIDSLLDEISGESQGLAENAQLQAENTKLRREVKKHRHAVKKMRGKLHEVGLLNAKLLYTNKILRKFDLNEDQKVKVLKQFDNAENMKEAKIIFNTLSESLDEGAKRKISETVNRRLSSSQSSTKPNKNIISDSNDLKSRFKKLANIKN